MAMMCNFHLARSLCLICFNVFLNWAARPSSRPTIWSLWFCRPVISCRHFFFHALFVWTFVRPVCVFSSIGLPTFDLFRPVVWFKEKKKEEKISAMALFLVKNKPTTPFPPLTCCCNPLLNCSFCVRNIVARSPTVLPPRPLFDRCDRCE